MVYSEDCIEGIGAEQLYKDRKAARFGIGFGFGDHFIRRYRAPPLHPHGTSTAHHPTSPRVRQSVIGLGAVKESPQRRIDDSSRRRSTTMTSR